MNISCGLHATHKHERYTYNTNKKLRAHSERKKQQKIVQNQINDKCPNSKQPNSATDRTTRSTVYCT